jgi:hypothetical protein
MLAAGEIRHTAEEPSMSSMGIRRRWREETKPLCAPLRPFPAETRTQMQLFAHVLTQPLHQSSRHYPSHSSEHVPRSRSHLRGACRGDYRYSRRRFGFVRSSRQWFLEKGRAETEARLGEITRSLLSHLLYKSLDGIFKGVEGREEERQPAFFHVLLHVCSFRRAS